MTTYHWKTRNGERVIVALYSAQREWRYSVAVGPRIVLSWQHSQRWCVAEDLLYALTGDHDSFGDLISEVQTVDVEGARTVARLFGWLREILRERAEEEAAWLQNLNKLGLKPLPA